MQTHGEEKVPRNKAGADRLVQLVPALNDLRTEEDRSRRGKLLADHLEWLFASLLVRFGIINPGIRGEDWLGASGQLLEDDQLLVPILRKAMMRIQSHGPLLALIHPLNFRP